jgi:hypothetical protein
MLDDAPAKPGPARRSPTVGYSQVLWSVGWGLLLAAVISAVLLVDLLPSDQVRLEAGDVSSRDILAPADLTYISEIRTRQAQDAQTSAIQEIYDPPDPAIARQQEVRLLQILDYIGSVRADPYATAEEKVRWIDAIPHIDLPPAVITKTLTLNDASWQQVVDEAPRVLVRAMQSEIRESQVDAVRRRLATLISVRLTEIEAQVVEALVRDLVVANTFYNAARTEEARGQAREATQPVSVTVRKGEAIVREGSLVRPIDLEALDALGLRHTAFRWQAALGAILLAISATALIEAAIYRFVPSLWGDGPALLVVFILIAIMVVVAKLMLPFTETVVPYLYPLPALSMLVAILFTPALGVVIGIAVGLVGAYLAGGSPEISFYLLGGALIGALSVGQVERLRTFLHAGAIVAVTQVLIIVAFGLMAPNQDAVTILVDALVGIVAGGLAASLTLAAFFALSAPLNLITPFQLMELSRPTQPLFRQLLLKAPGTYHHTLLVSNMVEEAADRIGADGLLARVGAYYHDVGKTLRPYFFAENRSGGTNPHDGLDPRTSAQIIISHVADGLDLADKYRLPAAIRAFIPEHHGTGLTLAFYRKAVQAAQENGREINEGDFRYPGPKPQSKETAILMLADICEARIRSAEPQTIEEIDRLIGETVKSRLDEGELDECNLTMHDLKEVRAAFLNVLQGVFHPRTKYPEPVKVKGPDGNEIVR